MNKSVWDTEPAEDLQKKAADLNKPIQDTWNKTNNPAPLVTEDDRKTGEVSKGITSGFRNHGENVNG